MNQRVGLSASRPSWWLVGVVGLLVVLLWRVATSRPSDETSIGDRPSTLEATHADETGADGEAPLARHPQP